MKNFEVNTKALEKDFLEVHVLINKAYPNWIQPLDNDVLSVFDKSKNKLLQKAEAMRWVLKDDQGKLIGRIAAFVNKKYTNKGDDVEVGGIGFFDCIDDHKAAALLFNTAKKWLMDRGMEAMDGPINLGDRDKWWGLLVDGFHPPIYNMNYNPPYYKNLFEAYGFRNFYDQLCWSLTVSGEAHQLAPKFYEAHKKYSGDPDFKAEFINKKNLEKYARDLSVIYNKAWAQHEGNKDISPEQVLKLFKTIKPVLDEKLIWFAYYKDEPVAMWVNLPDINQVIKHLHGKFGWFSKLKFFLIKKLVKNENFIGLAFGVVPEFQGKGLDYYLIVEAEQVIKSTTSYKKLELYWQGDFNPKILGISKNLGGKHSRTLVTYRYLFDRNKKFERHPVLL
ncbi:hypothetical protein [Robertkochia sediminum]|uniref:hypothetical protein n=1 Tax=Robertkochia sediminum TaxID=2785326 RepID=UPI0019345A9F|nr:hypothetical protein [Robertkochia sediminum]MBL7471230.1 hypothetical protein [Robertkochia sediminum]